MESLAPVNDVVNMLGHASVHIAHPLWAMQLWRSMSAAHLLFNCSGLKCLKSPSSVCVINHDKPSVAKFTGQHWHNKLVLGVGKSAEYTFQRTARDDPTCSFLHFSKMIQQH